MSDFIYFFTFLLIFVLSSIVVVIFFWRKKMRTRLELEHEKSIEQEQQRNHENKRIFFIETKTWKDFFRNLDLCFKFQSHQLTLKTRPYFLLTKIYWCLWSFSFSQHSLIINFWIDFKNSLFVVVISKETLKSSTILGFFMVGLSTKSQI